jgi:hypothetical protein
MSSKDPEEEPEYSPRPNDFLVEPMLAPFEKKPDEKKPEDQSPQSLLGRLFGWLSGGR